MVINYNLEMEKIVSELKNTNEKPKLLLHACCAPCASSCIERLKDYFDITAYFYNPNMDSEAEFKLRADELKRLCEYFDVDCIIEPFAHSEFLRDIKGLEGLAEGGNRCLNCFNLRLNKTAEKAIERFDYFATTLTVSPLKSAEAINKIGQKIAKEKGVKFLPSDFKKKNGYVRSVEISKVLGLYRQNYCGCEFSKKVEL